MKKSLMLFVFISFLVYYFWPTNKILKKSEVKVSEDLSSDITEVKKVATRSIANEKNEKKISHQKNKSLKPKVIFSKNTNLKFKLKNRAPSSLEAYFDDSLVKLNGKSFLISNFLRTLPVEEYSLENGDEIFKKSGYIFFESNDKALGMPALYHKDNKTLAALTGRVILKNMSEVQAKSISKRMGLKLDTSMRHLNIYAINVSLNLFEVLEDLGPKKSSAEIIEGYIREK